MQFVVEGMMNKQQNKIDNNNNNDIKDILSDSLYYNNTTKFLSLLDYINERLDRLENKIDSIGGKDE